MTHLDTHAAMVNMNYDRDGLSGIQRTTYDVQKKMSAVNMAIPVPTLISNILRILPGRFGFTKDDIRKRILTIPLMEVFTLLRAKEKALEEEYAIHKAKQQAGRQLWRDPRNRPDGAGRGRTPGAGPGAAPGAGRHPRRLAPAIGAGEGEGSASAQHGASGGYRNNGKLLNMNQFCTAYVNNQICT